jgi:hypothetical protein
VKTRHKASYIITEVNDVTPSIPRNTCTSSRQVHRAGRLSDTNESIGYRSNSNGSRKLEKWNKVCAHTSHEWTTRPQFASAYQDPEALLQTRVDQRRHRENNHRHH